MHASQNDLLLAELRKGPLTAVQMLERLGIARGSARVMELRQAGWDIRSTPINVTNRRGESCRVALYSLADTQCTLLPQPAPGRGRMHACAA